MGPRFREDKTVQAAACFLRHEGSTMNYMKLIKLLYFMDRRALKQWGHPVTYDHYVSMRHGPVLSLTLDRINEADEPGSPSYWSQHIAPPHQYSVTLEKDPPNDELSEAELHLIDEVHAEYGHMNQWELRDPSSPPVALARYLRAAQLLHGANHLYVGCNDEILLASCDELVQFWNDPSGLGATLTALHRHGSLRRACREVALGDPTRSLEQRVRRRARRDPQLAARIAAARAAGRSI